MPSAQDESTPTPAASTTSRMDRSGGTVRVRPLRRSSIVERARRAPARSSGRAENRSRCSARDGHAALRVLDGGEQRLRPAAVDERVGLRGAQQGRQVEQARLVLRADGHPVAVRRQLVEERHRGAACGRRRRGATRRPRPRPPRSSGGCGVIPIPPAMNR